MTFDTKIVNGELPAIHADPGRSQWRTGPGC
jgi:hypothetical protein